MLNKRAMSVIGAAAGLFFMSAASNAADVYFRKSATRVDLSASGGVPTTVLAVSVPPGVWKVTGKASLVNFGAQDFGRCTVTAGATNLNGAATMTGSASGQPAVATVIDIGMVTTSAIATTIRLRCTHDFFMGGEYVDPDAVLLIERVFGTRG